MEEGPIIRTRSQNDSCCHSRKASTLITIVSVNPIQLLRDPSNQLLVTDTPQVRMNKRITVFNRARREFCGSNQKTSQKGAYSSSAARESGMISERGENNRYGKQRRPRHRRANPVEVHAPLLATGNATFDRVTSELFEHFSIETQL